MSKKLYAAFVPLFAVAAFASMSAVAQAQPHWYSDGVKLAGGKTVKVTTKGTLAVIWLGKTVTCKAKDNGTVTNPTSGAAGYGNITEFVMKECESVPATCAAGEVVEFPAAKGGEPLSAENGWPSTLLAGPPIRTKSVKSKSKLNATTQA